MSGGQFELAGEVVPRWFTARHAASYYVQDEDFAFGTFGDFVVDILDAADPVIDFSRFDNDGHGNRADYSSGMAPGRGRHYNGVKPRAMHQRPKEAESEAGLRGLKWCWPCSWFSPDSLGWPRPCSHRVQ